MLALDRSASTLSCNFLHFTPRKMMLFLVYAKYFSHQHCESCAGRRAGAALAGAMLAYDHTGHVAILSESV
jgi:hypothetical protein